MLRTTVVVIMKVTTKVTSYLYANKIVLTATIAEFKLEVAHSAPNTIMLTSTIRLAIKPSQSKVITQSIDV